ncbi:GldG family protein [Candidatus Woesebacteria bacterium]|nr:GldG family protein [Candidatus Woesebacteria bacterium]
MKRIRALFSTLRLGNVNLYRRLQLHRFRMPAIVLVVCIVAVVSNLIVSNLSYRFDFSQGQAYTLSPASRDIIHSLKKDTTISFITSSEIPTRLKPVEREVVDLLNEFARAGGKVHVETLDASKNQDAATKAQTAGLQQLQFSQLTQENYQVSHAYFGIVISYGDKTDVIQQVGDVNNLEYNIAASLYTMSSEQVPSVAFLGVEQSILPQQDPVATIKSLLDKQFDVTYISAPVVAGDEPNEPFTIDSATKAVLIFDLNNRTYSDEEIAELEKYIAQGGHVIAFLNGIGVQSDLSALPAEHNLFGLTRKYGIDLQKNLLLSANSEIVNFGDGSVSFLTAYPYWLKTNVMNQDAPYFSNAVQFTFPWASSLALTEGNNQTVTPLIQTTTRSWEKSDVVTVSPDGITNPKPSEFKQFVVAAESKARGRGNVMVVASSRFVADQFISNNSSNVNFVLNTLNNYVSDGVLGSIRQRAVTIYPLPDIPASAQDVFKYLNMFLLPGLFGIYGFIRLWKRSRSQ